ncbi:hypothetical protein GCM10011491_42240 [Brucella endophytica]|uniref:DUF262 domain-containing protein n=1 Tax=Brucella endophytica TaxID=1963359 RepID=A0A916SRC2_9HYPH|nr:DUF262 domain-containing protein [Brucella endophytica]GGB09858.1 hypothetical protein GCM10011491_42240 [Brucella endophytica]
MKAGPVTIRQLLENRQRFCVPIYQRHYVWTRDKQWLPFWNDVRTKAIERLNGRERRFSHFMGAVVLEARGSVSSRQVTSFQVVDGQQRLTTFQLYLAAARDYAKQAGFDDTVGLVEGYLFNEKQHLMEDAEVEKFKVWPTKYDRVLFQDIVTLGRLELRKKYSAHFYKGKDKIYDYSTVPNLLGAYGFFFEHIRHAVESDDLEDDFAETIDGAPDEEDEVAQETVDQDRAAMELRLDALWESLIEEFKVVEIILEEGDDAQVIFETLNERGEPLLAADLVRNNIFHRADARQEKAEKLFEKHWKDFEAPFWSEMEKQGRYKKARIEFFLANFIAGQVAGEVTLSKLFSEYKAFLKVQADRPGGGYQTVDVELTDLARYGALYRRLLEKKLDDPLGHFAWLLSPWDVTTVYPLILRLWAEDGMGDGERQTCLDTVLSFIVRRAICGLTTKNYNKFFLSVLRHLEAKGFSAERLSAFLIAQTSESARFPTDREFEAAWLSAPVYGKRLTPLRVRAVLEAIERQKRHKFHETEHLSTDLSVEHILPAEWKAHWPLGDGNLVSSDEAYQAVFAMDEDETRVGQIVRRQRLLNTFGNLTILTQPLNSSVRNGKYEIKRKALQDHSLLVMNREITKVENWNEDTIEARGKLLFETAQEVWPYPSTVIAKAALD